MKYVELVEDKERLVYAHGGNVYLWDKKGDPVHKLKASCTSDEAARAAARLIATR